MHITLPPFSTQFLSRVIISNHHHHYTFSDLTALPHYLWQASYHGPVLLAYCLWVLFSYCFCFVLLSRKYPASVCDHSMSVPLTHFTWHNTPHVYPCLSKFHDFIFPSDCMVFHAINASYIGSLSTYFFLDI